MIARELVARRDEMLKELCETACLQANNTLVDRTNDLYSNHAMRLVGSAYDHRNGFAVLL